MRWLALAVLYKPTLTQLHMCPSFLCCTLIRYEKKLSREEYHDKKAADPTLYVYTAWLKPPQPGQLAGRPHALVAYSCLLHSTYRDNLHQLGTVGTVEDFWRHYVHMKRPSELEEGTNVYLFRDGHVPMWESYPQGGCWILKLRKTPGVSSKLWQDLLLAAIGEVFEEPTVAGVGLATRAHHDILSLWNSDNSLPALRFKLGEKLREALDLPSDKTLIQYKAHARSLVDKHTFSNTEDFVFMDQARGSDGGHKQAAGHGQASGQRAGGAGERSSSGPSGGSSRGGRGGRGGHGGNAARGNSQRGTRAGGQRGNSGQKGRGGKGGHKGGSGGQQRASGIA